MNDRFAVHQQVENRRDAGPGWDDVLSGFDPGVFFLPGGPGLKQARIGHDRGALKLTGDSGETAAALYYNPGWFNGWSGADNRVLKPHVGTGADGTGNQQKYGNPPYHECGPILGLRKNQGRVGAAEAERVRQDRP